jgi:NTE family protein
MKRALVISGGGSKGAFAVGVLKTLLSTYPHLDFDIFVGTSAGSLIVTLASLRQIDVLEQVYTTTSTADIITKFDIGDRINEHSLFSVDGEWNKINAIYPDQKYAQLLSSGKKVFLTAACLQNKRLTVFATDAQAIQPDGYDVVQLINADHYRKALLSSTCEPVFMPPVKVNLHVPDDPHPDYQFVDGGVMKYAGVQMAIDAGATEIFTILLSPEADETTPNELTHLLSILERTIDIFTNDIGKNDLLVPQQYNTALMYIAAVKNKMITAGLSEAQVNDFFTIEGNVNPFEGKQPLKLFNIRPGQPLGGGPGGLDFVPEEMKQMLAKGEAAADNFIVSLPPGDITWA